MYKGVIYMQKTTFKLNQETINECVDCSIEKLESSKNAKDKKGQHKAKKQDLH